MLFGIKVDFDPDQSHHESAANYYESNWLPAPIEDSSIVYTYGKEGYSRLNDLDGSYWMSGETEWLA